MKLGAGFFRELARAFGIAVGDREKMHRGMLRRQGRAQCADAT